jgi:hypothetical protein
VYFLCCTAGWRNRVHIRKPLQLFAANFLNNPFSIDLRGVQHGLVVIFFIQYYKCTATLYPPIIQKSSLFSATYVVPINGLRPYWWTYYWMIKNISCRISLNISSTLPQWLQQSEMADLWNLQPFSNTVCERGIPVYSVLWKTRTPLTRTWKEHGGNIIQYIYFYQFLSSLSVSTQSWVFLMNKEIVWQKVKALWHWNDTHHKKN